MLIVPFIWFLLPFSTLCLFLLHADVLGPVMRKRVENVPKKKKSACMSGAPPSVSSIDQIFLHLVFSLFLPTCNRHLLFCVLLHHSSGSVWMQWMYASCYSRSLLLRALHFFPLSTVCESCSLWTGKAWETRGGKGKKTARISGTHDASQWCKKHTYTDGRLLQSRRSLCCPYFLFFSFVAKA